MKNNFSIFPDSSVRGFPAIFSKGFSLIELMVALTIGLLLVGGIIFLFSSTSRVSTSQEAVARLQENGRYAMSRIISDLRMARGQACSNSGGVATLPAGSPKIQDSVRSVNVYSSPNTGLLAQDSPSDTYSPPSGWPNTEPFLISPSMFMQGYECANGTGSCTPTLSLSGISVAGTDVGNRSKSGDVLTVRYLQPQGWSAVATCAGGALQSLAVTRAATDPPFTSFNGGGNVAPEIWLSDCTTSQVLQVETLPTTTVSTMQLDMTVNASNRAPIACPSVQSDLRVFDVRTQFVGVTYYLQIRSDPNPDAPDRKISSLIRRQGMFGSTEGGDVITDGVERLDFLYAVEDADGMTRYLTADQVESATNCPPPPVGFTAQETGCMWRAVKAVEVHLLMNTVNDISLDNSEQKYRYTFDNNGDLGDTPTTLPSGLSPGRMIRKEFTALVSLRNYNN